MPSKPDTMTRLLDTIAALGGDVPNGYKLHNKPESRRPEFGRGPSRAVGVWRKDNGWHVSNATPIEIMAAAFVLVKLLMSHGVKFEEELDGKYCVWKRRIGDSAPFDLVSTDFIEALLLAGEKLREGSK